MGRLLVGTAFALLVTTLQADACDKGQLNTNFRKFFSDKDSPYNLKFMAMTAESAKKSSSALENLTDTYKEYFAKDAAAAGAINSCDKQTIVDAALQGSKK
jgi:hypothetical protein